MLEQIYKQTMPNHLAKYVVGKKMKREFPHTCVIQYYSASSQQSHKNKSPFDTKTRNWQNSPSTEITGYILKMQHLINKLCGEGQFTVMPGFSAHLLTEKGRAATLLIG